MIKRQSPTIPQANALFLITAVVTLVGTALLQPRLGFGTNLWVNEFVYILLPPLLLAKVNGWPVEEVYRFRKTSAKNKMISMLSGICLWFFAAYISNITRVLLDSKIGAMISPLQTGLSIYQTFLLIIGMIILAPICEEIFFRGLVQRAYEGRSKKYAFVMAGLIFGSYHILNSISEVIPACILGIFMGYLVYKTDSIASSMLFHAAVNTCAVALGAVFQISSLHTIPVWFHVIAFAGLGSSIALLRLLKGPEQSADSKDEEQKPNKASALGIIFLILAMVYLAAIGVVEILARSQYLG